MVPPGTKSGARISAAGRCMTEGLEVSGALTVTLSNKGSRTHRSGAREVLRWAELSFLSL